MNPPPDSAVQNRNLPPRTLRIGHSPDPDDAFMWWPLANFTLPDGTKLEPKIDTRGYAFVHVLEDIQSLNDRSERGELEITALSIHQYPFVAKDYALTTCGASMGDGYGPMVVTPEGSGVDLANLQPRRIAIPGTRTSAWLALQLYLRERGAQAPDSRSESAAPSSADASSSADSLRESGSAAPIDYAVVPFDQIIPRVQSGEFAAGLIIHEGQLTYADAGLRCLVDLGKWWKQTRGLPLPLGGNAIRRDVGSPRELATITAVLLDSIRYALEHRDEAVAFALHWARGMGHDLADRFVGMYVNDSTLDYGDTGRRAVEQFLREGVEASLIPAFGEVDFIAPA